MEAVGTRDTPGKPELFATTKQFLDDLGLLSLGLSMGQWLSLPMIVIVYNNNAWGVWPNALRSARSMHMYVFQENLRYDKMAEGLGAQAGAAFGFGSPLIRMGVGRGSDGDELALDWMLDDDGKGLLLYPLMETSPRSQALFGAFGLVVLGAAHLTILGNPGEPAPYTATSAGSASGASSRDRGSSRILHAH